MLNFTIFLNKKVLRKIKDLIIKNQKNYKNPLKKKYIYLKPLLFSHINDRRIDQSKV